MKRSVKRDVSPVCRPEWRMRERRRERTVSESSMPQVALRDEETARSRAFTVLNASEEGARPSRTAALWREAMLSR